MAEERARHPGAAVEVWAFDEHRAGLKPVPRRAWAKRGRRPVAVAEPRYQWLYLYGFVRPTSGAVEWFLCNAVNTALFAAVLARFAAAVGAGPDKRVILVLETAPAGTPPSASPCQRAFGWSSCRRTRPSRNRPSACGR
ncbi:MAG TPA: transposase [Geminicoccaceae bacterium]|nr:transposase [Geminicoccaceae bacterium]